MLKDVYKITPPMMKTTLMKGFYVPTEVNINIMISNFPQKTTNFKENANLSIS